MSSLRAVRRLPNPGEIFVAREKSSTPLRTRTRQHRDDYQGSLNSQLIPDRINFPAPAQADRSYTGSINIAAAIYRIRRRGECSRRAARPKQSVVLRLDRCVAFACGLAEAFQIGDLDMSPAVVDDIGLLQRIGHQRYAVAAGADHLRHRFLRQNESVAAG